jgi:hypothetical protein
MKRLFVVTAVIEAGAGAALLGVPSWTVALLLGSPLDAPAALALGRVAGAALLALGAANWFAHYDPTSRAARGLAAAMVLYNLGSVVILGRAGLGPPPAGVALWPTVLLHAAMTAWCIAALRSPTPPSH